MRQASRKAADEPEESAAEDMGEGLQGAQEGLQRIEAEATAGVKAAKSEDSVEEAAERPPALAPAVLARQWPDRERPRGLRDVRPSSSLGRERFEE